MDESKEELLIREGEISLPTADVQADAYNFESGTFQVAVSDILNVQNNIEAVMLAVWTNEDQSDLQWIQMERKEEGEYCASINIPNFNYKVGEYFVDAYVVDGEGGQYMVGSASNFVE
ncbi:MAG: GBS Bsp-like repeat-containing protein [[Clostridium] scindens]